MHNLSHPRSCQCIDNQNCSFMFYNTKSNTCWSVFSEALPPCWICTDSHLLPTSEMCNKIKLKCIQIKSLKTVTFSFWTFYHIQISEKINRLLTKSIIISNFKNRRWSINNVLLTMFSTFNSSNIFILSSCFVLHMLLGMAREWCLWRLYPVCLQYLRVKLYNDQLRQNGWVTLLQLSCFKMLVK